jgi:hypothetical protein
MCIQFDLIWSSLFEGLEPEQFFERFTNEKDSTRNSIIDKPDTDAERTSISNLQLGSVHVGHLQ